MNKKVIEIACVAGAVVLGCVAFIAGAAINNRNIADESPAYEESFPEVKLLTELKVGKYYLENGTKDEYIEVFDDKTLQFFGFDYFQDSVIKIPANQFITSLSESEYAEHVAAYQEEIDFWKSRIYYFPSKQGQSILLSDEPIITSGAYHTLSYTDENTIAFSEKRIYKFAE